MDRNTLLVNHTHSRGRSKRRRRYSLRGPPTSSSHTNDTENAASPTNPISHDVTRGSESVGVVDVRDKCCYEGRYFWDALKAIVARQLFFVHALIAIWRLSAVSGNGKFWYMTLTFTGLVAETLIILFWKRGQEWKWFQPSVFCYLICVVPPIWLLELDHLGFVEFLQRPSNHTSHDVYEIFPWIKLDKQQWLLALEQSLLVLVILNRWIIPKGALTRDGLSSLLLTHLGTACDIVDFYSILSEPSNRERVDFCYLVLTIWTVSIHQFCIVCTAKRDVAAPGDSQSSSSEENSDSEQDDSAKASTANTRRSRQLHRKIEIDQCAIAVPIASGEEIEKRRDRREERKRQRRQEQQQGMGMRNRGQWWYRRFAEKLQVILLLLLETDAWSTILSLLMQDLPFFVIRATTIFAFNILNYTNCFFAAKNLLVLILQCYRVWCVLVEHHLRREETRKERKDMWLVKVQFLDYPDPKKWRKERDIYNNRYFKF